MDGYGSHVQQAISWSIIELHINTIVINFAKYSKHGLSVSAVWLICYALIHSLGNLFGFSWVATGSMFVGTISWSTTELHVKSIGMKLAKCSKYGISISIILLDQSGRLTAPKGFQ